jgi:hypothetical protein
MLNQDGLISSLTDAKQAAEWASQDGHAEIFLYLPWRLD